MISYVGHSHHKENAWIPRGLAIQARLHMWGIAPEAFASQRDDNTDPAVRSIRKQGNGPGLCQPEKALGRLPASNTSRCCRYPSVGIEKLAFNQ